MANIYTVNSTTTSPIDVSTGLIDNPGSFPPASGYFLTIRPNPGQDIAANQFRIGSASLPTTMSLQGDINSQTVWPSKIEWVVNAAFITGVAVYKYVFQDSENPTNALNFTGGGTNKVYVWIYFGDPHTQGTTPITSAVDLSNVLDIDFSTDPITRNETLQQNSVILDTGTLTSFTI